jgi:heme exporter protein A
MELSGSGLECIRGGKEVFANVHFRVRSAEAMLVLGPNGAGKSSLLRIVAGLLRPAAGRFELAGGDPERTLAEQAHYLGHQDPLKGSLSARENLGFWAQFLGGGLGKALGEALETVGLDRLGDLPAGYLSAGQRRRLSIGRLLAVERPVWLLDEPASTLDASGQALLAGLMRNHLDNGGLILAATHAPLGLDGARELRLGTPRPTPPPQGGREQSAALP